MLIQINEEILVIEDIENAVLIINQKFLLQNKSKDEFLKEIEITANMFETQQISNMINEIIG